MTISDTRYLVLGALVLSFCIGMLFLYWAISGMRRGEFHCRYGLFHKGDDGWLFWAVTFTCAASGLGVIVGSIWLGFRTLP
jgi:hypothetical protein